MRILKLYSEGCEKLLYELTTEELPSGIFISTFWNCEMELEEDRHVTEFETYSTALAHMYKTALKHTLHYSSLELFERGEV